MRTISTITNVAAATINLIACLIVYKSGATDIVPYAICLSMVAVSGAIVFVNLKYAK